VALATVSDRYTDEQIRRYYAEGLRRGDTMFGVLEEQVAQRPDKVFLSDATTSCTFGDLHQAALRLAAGLCCYLVPAVGADPLTLQQVKDYLLGAGLAVHKVPERLEVVGELPMTATGKIQKHLLRADIARKLDQLP
jgi:non-ribosomal peptide synthetase component E (peptide arylation enzyme)